MQTYRAGIDIGSTTVKLVLLNQENEIIYGEYQRHCAHTQEALTDLLRDVRTKLGNCLLEVKITGSGKIVRERAFGNHILAKKSKARKRNMKTDAVVNGKIKKNIKTALGV